MDIDDTVCEPRLHALAARYARAIDRRDVAELLAVFHPDAVLLSARPGREVARWDGHEQIREVTAIMARWQRTHHLVGQCLHEVLGEQAEGEVYCIAHHFRQREGGEWVDHVMHIVYDDHYRIGADGRWRIARRRTRVEAECHHPAPLLRLAQRPGPPVDGH